MKRNVRFLSILLCYFVFMQETALAQAGTTWASQTTPATSQTWNGITYGNGLYVAVGGSGTGNRVMTSTDGITWTAQTTPADNNWIDITYGNGLFVAWPVPEQATG